MFAIYQAIFQSQMCGKRRKTYAPAADTETLSGRSRNVSEKTLKKHLLDGCNTRRGWMAANNIYMK